MWDNGYGGDIETEKGMTRDTKDANDRNTKSTAGEPAFRRTPLCRPIPLSEGAFLNQTSPKSAWETQIEKQSRVII